MTLNYMKLLINNVTLPIIYYNVTKNEINLAKIKTTN